MLRVCQESDKYVWTQSNPNCWAMKRKGEQRDCVLKFRSFAERRESFILVTLLKLCALVIFVRPLSWIDDKNMMSIRQFGANNVNKRSSNRMFEGHLFSCSPIVRHQKGRGKWGACCLHKDNFIDFKRGKKSNYFGQGSKWITFEWKIAVYVCMKFFAFRF